MKTRTARLLAVLVLVAAASSAHGLSIAMEPLPVPPLDLRPDSRLDPEVWATEWPAPDAFQVILPPPIQVILPPIQVPPLSIQSDELQDPQEPE